MYTESYFYSLMPYCLARQPDGRYAVVNRRYNPVGVVSLDLVAEPVCVHLPGLTPETAARIAWNGSGNLKQVYLYGGRCHPMHSKAAMDDYLARLRLLARLKVGL